MNFLAHFFSILFSPLLIPTYAVALSLWTTELTFAPTKTKLYVLFFTFAITCMLQLVVIFMLNRFGIVKDPGLNNRNERHIPYILAIISYIGVALYLSAAHSPKWMMFFMIGAAAVALVNLLVNLKWKISGHAASIGGLVALVFAECYYGYSLFNNNMMLVIALLVAGAVMTSRLILRRHTLAQVMAGFANGFIIITVFEIFAKNGI